MKRKLATIAVIDEIRPHPDADALELAKIRGWQVVVKIGEFQPKDLCVYVEIDSVMPEKREFEFLAPRKYRIKTTKLRGQVSQGIAFPLSILPGNIEVFNGIKKLTYNRDSVNLSPGADVTDFLGIEKYEEPIPACLGGTASGRFPSHSIKTDEERIQNLTDNFEDYRRWYLWTATEKLDGSSCTYTIYEDEFGVASRNLALKENDTNSFWKYARENDVERKMREIIKENKLKALTLQGELIGEGIQKNKYRIKGQEVRFFRVFDPISYRFFHVEVAKDIIEGRMGLKFVPIIETDMTLPETIEELVAYSDGRSALYDTAREGVVFVAEFALPGIDVETGLGARSLEEYQNRLSFKVISNKFILKHDL
jgi:RNA ligase (TIGR02306 family)